MIKIKILNNSKCTSIIFYGKLYKVKDGVFEIEKSIGNEIVKKFPSSYSKIQPINEPINEPIKQPTTRSKTYKAAEVKTNLLDLE